MLPYKKRSSMQSVIPIKKAVISFFHNRVKVMQAKTADYNKQRYFLNWLVYRFSYDV